MLIPLFASVRILADSIASLPIQLYRRGFGTREPITFVPQLFFQPAARDNLFQWLHKCVVSLALRGNAYGLVTLRDNLDFPIMIEWLNPDEIWVDDSRPTMPVYYWLGNEVPREDIVHIPWVAMPGRVKGLSPVAAFAQTIGVGLAVTDYGKSWYDNGGTPPATMKNSAKTINPQESREIQGRLSAAMRSRKPLVFGSDWDFTALQVSPEESQFIETMKLNATQIAAIWGIPPEMVGGDQGGPLSYSSPEQNMIHLVSVTLRPWLVRLETVFSDLMPGREFVKFNVDAMIRTSLLDRYTAHGMALAQGWRNVDEIRAIEDLPPLPNGQGAGYGSAALPAPAPPNNDNSA
ncbi:phage portal protein [Streptomyces sp. NBC_01451]|uniref:phage portal protein n=1 Tax=Streptomyces sp. NBC_01451 TaxID=2903872 RepID=UPI002E33E7EE|nr:phage portal protein [Streptomyces sp. NBC_01451]